MLQPSGYLKGAWDLVVALVTDPLQAARDIGVGYREAREEYQGNLIPTPSIITAAGAGSLAAALLTGATPLLGLATLAVGLGRFRSIGAESREFEVEIGKILHENIAARGRLPEESGLAEDREVAFTRPLASAKPAVLELQA